MQELYNNLIIRNSFKNCYPYERFKNYLIDDKVKRKTIYEFLVEDEYFQDFYNGNLSYEGFILKFINPQIK